ncbi:MAG: hypothetical protein HN700_07530 [Verrucomicrobia bacterium]|nr:hypothetical protein [Verrucomicrobiota bacterium]
MATDTPPTKRQTAAWRYVLLAALPVVLVVLAAEFVLHRVGFPYDPGTLMRSHFVPAEAGWIVTRPLFTRIETSACAQRIPQKRDGMLRIALLGGSSVKLMGDATPLEERLEQELGRDVQILNFGLCGCGSDRALVAAREALQLDADAIALYSGHNEFISESNPRTYRQRGWLHRNSRILQLCIGNAWIPEPGKLYGPAEKQEIYAQFERNLRDLAGMCRDAGVPLVVGTVASNLRIPPIIYARELYEKTELPPEPMLEFQRGAALFGERRYTDAKRVLQQAIAASPRPWRATWQNNKILRDVAKELSVPLADVEQRIMDASPQGIPGPDLFSDQCHLNGRGYGILADTFAEIVVRELRQ